MRPWFLLLLFALPLAADEKDDIRDALRRAGQYADQGEQIEQMVGEYDATEIWVRKAIILVEFADMQDRRAILPLARALEDKKFGHVVGFALHGLARQSAEDLRKGGGVELVELLIDALKIKRNYHRRVAREVLTKIVGEDLGSKSTKWKAWLRKNEEGEALALDMDAVVFDERRFDPELVTQVMQEGYDAGTQLRDRIPDPTTAIEELNEFGLDVALCLDQTSSMESVIEAAKANMTTLVTVLGEVVEDYRVGVVTYDDAVRKNEPLSSNPRAIREMIAGVRAEGGGDIPEGVDKALIAALDPAFGWARRSTKTVVVLGDAPPHAVDQAATEDLVQQAHEQGKVTTHCVSTGFSAVMELNAIAEKGGGQGLTLSSPAALISEVLLLVFGEGMRPSMERFVPVLVEILEEE